MRQSSANPPQNVLPPSADEATLVQAIQMSGYPLQAIVAEKLMDAGFEVVEEWGYIDKDTDEQRSLDLLAFKKWGEDKHPVVPRLILLIECKRTIHPFVFFKKVSVVPVPDFPVVSAVKLGMP